MLPLQRFMHVTYGQLAVRLAIVAATSLPLWLFGCSGNDELYPISGNVTFEGEPVPTGRLVFIPDDDSGNRGPRTEADVRDGQYQSDPTTGVVGGKYVVEIDAFAPDDGAEGELVRLLPLRRMKVDLPSTGGRHDFELVAD